MDKPMRVLVITSEWPTPERPYAVPYLVRQVAFLRRAGIEVDVFSFRGAKRPINYLRAWRQVRGKLKQGNYNLVHAQFGQSSILPWPKRLPLVVTFHGCDIQGVKRFDGRPTLAGKMLQRFCKFVAARADAVIIVSERMRRHLPRNVVAPVIPTGVDLESWPRMEQGEARRHLGLPPDERLVLFVGDPSDTVKRHGLAQRAVEILNESRPVKLIVGWGMSHENILVLMNACDVLVMTSIQEGSPCVIKEALACNLPVVSLDVGDVALRLQGVAGCEVCEDDRAETIAASLERVLSRGGRINGREAVKDLDEKLLTEKLIHIYQSVLEAGKQPGASRHMGPA